MHELKGFVPQQREAAESGVLQREARVAAYLQYVHQANGQKQAALLEQMSAAEAVLVGRS